MKKILFLSAFIMSASFAFAHERQVINIGGKDYLFVVGSLSEPVVVGDKSGLDLKVALADPRDLATSTSKGVIPVLGLEKTLKVQNISEDGITSDFELKTAWGNPGNYETLFYPSSSKKLTYRIYGQIDGKDVDFKFTCNPAGHVMNDHNMNQEDMSNGDYKIDYMAGSFGCPLEKDDLFFPPVSKQKDLVQSNALAIVALALSVIAFARTRKS
jgi:hypothetical protein